MSHTNVLELGPRDRLLAGVQLAGMVAGWLIMFAPLCLFVAATAVRDAFRRRV